MDEWGLVVEHEQNEMWDKFICVSSITTFIFPVNASLYDCGCHGVLFLFRQYNHARGHGNKVPYKTLANK